MPTYQIISPSGKKISVTGPTPPSESELDNIFSKIESPAQSQPSLLDRMKQGVEALARSGGPTTAITAGADMAASPQTLQETMAMNKGRAQGVATGVRYGVPLMAPIGGPAGSVAMGVSEKLAQMIEGSDNPRAVAQSTALGALPLGEATKVFSGANLGNVAKIGATNLIVNKISDAIGLPSDTPDSTKQALIVGGITAMNPILGKALGKMTGYVSPEELASIAAKKNFNAEEDATLAKWQPRGAVVNPSRVNPSAVNNTLGAMAGIQNVGNEATRLNTPLTDAAAKRVANIPANTRINADSLELARQRIAAPLEELRGMGADEYINAWDKANNSRQRAAAGEVNGIPGADILKADAEAAMSGLQQKMDSIAVKNKRPDLVGVAPKTQELWAKNYDVQSMTPTGTGHLNPALASAAAARRGEGQLTGELRDIAQLNNIAGAETRNINDIAPHGGTLGPHASLIGAVAGSSPIQSLAGSGIPLLRGPIRDLLLSPGWQSGENPIAKLLGGGAVRNYTPRTSADPEISAALARLVAQASMQRALDSYKNPQ